MIKSNPIPTRWVIHKLENSNNTKQVLPLLWMFWTPHQASQPGDWTKGLRIPREFGLEGQWDLTVRPPQNWEQQTPVLEGTNKILHREQKQWPHRRLSQTCMPVLEGLLWRHGPARAHHRDRLAAAVLEGTPWHKPPWRSPLTLLQSQ